jgi:crotonobetainyl-CoA:carnitine CoA-transferase CaiB-like acyl-CoA transferase
MTYALEGILVLDFGANLAGPFGPMILGDLGAQVIKIEEVGTEARTMGRGSSFFGCQRGKRSLAIDLKTPEGTEVIHKLIARADIIHHNLRVGVAERLKIDYATAKRLNPRIIYCHTTGWGSTGPMASWPGWDQFGQAIGGIEWHGGGMEHGNPPMWYRYGQCDATNAMHSVQAVLWALYHRDKTGEGQLVETNIINGGVTLNSDLFITKDGPASRPVIDKEQRGLGPLYRLYETKRGWILLACLTPEEWMKLTEALREANLAQDSRFATPQGRKQHASELSALLESVFIQKTAEEWFRTLDAHKVPVEISSETYWKDMFDDPDAINSGFVVEYEMPVYGRLKQIGTWVEFSDTPGRIWGPPPLLGQHTVEILQELGYTANDARNLKGKGVVTFPE